MYDGFENFNRLLKVFSDFHEHQPYVKKLPFWITVVGVIAFCSISWAIILAVLAHLLHK